MKGMVFSRELYFRAVNPEKVSYLEARRWFEVRGLNHTDHRTREHLYDGIYMAALAATKGVKDEVERTFDGWTHENPA